jgi:enoyl-CoA hydratase/carnithine racemase
VIVRERDGDVEVLRLDRPAQRNAMSTALLVAFVDALDELAADDGLRALVISTTSTAALSAGADVGEELDAAGGLARMTLFTRLYTAIDAFPAPTIAVCVGNCVGAGAELAAGCDLRVAGDNLKLAWAGAKHGVPVGPARLTTLIGMSRAKEIVYSGRVVGAQEALTIGLAHDAVGADAAEARALERAHGLGDVRTLKRLFADVSGSAAHVAGENAALLEFQARGRGLPRRG